VLKQHFRATVLEAEASATGDARGDGQNATLRLVTIDGEHRKNAAISARRSNGLHARDRFDDATLAAAAPDTSARTSLTSTTDTVSLDGGYAMPWGRKNLQLSANGSFSGSHRDLAGEGQGQSNQSFNAGVSASLNGSRKTNFWDLNLSLSGAHNASSLHGGSDPANLSSSTQSDSLSANAMAMLSGPLMHVLGHAAIYDVNLNYQKSNFWQSAGLGIAGNSSSQQSVNTSGGLTLPLHERGKGHSLLGQLALGGHVNAQHSTGSAWVMGYDSNASWSPVDGLQFDINRNVIGSPGGSASVLSIQTDVLVFDPRTHQDVRVTQLSGSNPDLRSSTTTSTDLRATYMHRLLSTQASLGVGYNVTRTSNPSWSPTLSDIAESAFPDHFLRDASGQLVQVDTRPVNALRQSDSRLSLNLHLSGGRGAPAPGTPLPPSSSFKPLIWNLFMSSSWKMRSEFQLTPTGPTYDLNNASIGTSGGGSRRTTMIMGSMMRGVSGLRMSINWNGSGRLLGQGGADGIYRQPLKINMAAFTTVLQGKAPQSGLNLTLAVDNLLNRRPMVSFPDRATPFSQLPANLDPLGRVIKLSLRATLP
jgi:hypothetical protein